MPIDAERAGAVLTIDLDALAANYRLLAGRVAPAECAAVVKADAYGLGLAAVAPVLAAAGARTFFVALPEEGLALRALLPQAAVGVLLGLLPGCERDYLAGRLLPVLNSLDEIARWSALAREVGRRLPACLQIDTGMNRLGLGPDELAVLAEEPGRLAAVAMAGVLSHLACADTPGHQLTALQAERFAAARRRLPPAPASLANSSGVFRDGAYHLDLARPGSALYGVNPTPETANPMRPVVRLDGRILQLRTVEPGWTVGYGATHRTQAAGRLAVIAVGYADGFFRSLSSRGAVWIDGRLAPVVGRVSMDVITVDVSALPEGAVRPGQYVELIGPHRPLDAVAAEAGTIGYEVLTALGRRYARRHVGGPA